MSNVLKKNLDSEERVVEESPNPPDSGVKEVNEARAGIGQKVWRTVKGFFLDDENDPKKVKTVKEVVKREIKPEVLAENLFEKVKVDLEKLYNWGKVDIDQEPENPEYGLKELNRYYGNYKEMLYLIGEHFSKDLKFIRALDLYSKDLINEMPGGVYFSDAHIIREIMDEYSEKTDLLKMLLAEVFVIDRSRQVERVLSYLKVLPKGYVDSQGKFDDLVGYLVDLEESSKGLADRNHPMLAQILGHKGAGAVYRD